MNAKQKMAYHAREYRRLKSLLVGDAGAEMFASSVKTLRAKMKTEIGAYRKAESAWNSARDRYNREADAIAKGAIELNYRIGEALSKGAIDEQQAKMLIVECNKIAAGKV